MPKVSIIIANYNCTQFIGEAIESINKQSFSDWELIIVDDCSTDGSVGKIEKYQNDKVRLIKNSKNRGPHISRNIAMDAASGEYIAILDSDDIMLKKRIAIQVHYLDTHHSIDIAHSSYINFGEEKSINIAIVKDKDIRRKLFIGCPICNSTTMWRSSLGLRYSQNYPRSEDYNMWTMSIEKVFGGIKKPLIKHRIHGVQISHLGTYTQQLSDTVNGNLIKAYFPSIKKKEVDLFEKGRTGRISDNKQLEELDDLLVRMDALCRDDEFLSNLKVSSEFPKLIIDCCLRSSKGKISLNPFSTRIVSQCNAPLKERIRYIAKIIKNI